MVETWFLLAQEAAVKLVRAGQFRAFEQLCDYPDFRPLRGLLTVVCWDQCRDIDAAVALLEHVPVVKVTQL